MRVARVKLLLWMTAGLAALGAAACIVATVAMPLDLRANGAVVAVPHGAAASVNTQATDLPPLESFEPAWHLPLRRPLADPPATAIASTETSAKSVGLAVRLIGTIVDGQHARGVFLTGLSTVELKSAGDSVGGATVVAIDENNATLRFQGETLTIHRERNPFDPSGESYEAAARASSRDR